MVNNEWIPGATVTCKICNQRLSPPFCKELLKIAANTNASQAVKTISEHVNSTDGPQPISVKISKVPGMQTVHQIIFWGGINAERQDVTHRVRVTHPFQQLGLRSRPNKKQRDILGQLGWMALTPHTARPLQQGGLAGKNTLFWNEIANTWGHHGQVHEYVSASKRNEDCCTDAVCACCKRTRGMH
eukprot:scaffold81963_cov70-Attheya_sp.AAC.2